MPIPHYVLEDVRKMFEGHPEILCDESLERTFTTPLIMRVSPWVLLSIVSDNYVLKVTDDWFSIEVRRTPLYVSSERPLEQTKTKQDSPSSAPADSSKTE